MKKKVLVENGPDHNILTTVKIKKTVDNTSCTLHFCQELYNIPDWLCGCEVLNAFFFLVLFSFFYEKNCLEQSRV